jgi:hypothetical protein
LVQRENSDPTTQHYGGHLRKGAFLDLVKLVKEEFDELPQHEAEHIVKRLFRFDDPDKLDEYGVYKKIPECTTHVIVVGKKWDPEWMYSALYLADIISSMDGYQAFVACPLRWKILYLKDSSLYSYLIHERDLMDHIEAKSWVWLWNVSSRDQWFDHHIWTKINAFHQRVQVMDRDARYQWASDQVLRLVERPYDWISKYTATGNPKIIEQAKYFASAMRSESIPHLSASPPLMCQPNTSSSVGPS